ncbi:DoxX family protein [Arachidicoccus ginsenosidimutans]|uniref:DoxX family protein n=1 Tax=Arachidicoccus sp. BS20 TaxID=1850526 RepID=UPI0007F14888|nr:DoxX family protein [Arachidicoccus sp. BS20]ANI89159.1 DoxX family protein [Arachidicoccus sp. BS20]
MNKTAYLLTRLAIGISMFGHGFVRLFKLSIFAGGMIKEFEKSMLPNFIVTPFAYVLPFAEFFIGILLILGWFTKQAAIAGSIVMFILVFGSSMIENWSIIPSQLLHIVFFVFIVQFIQSNSCALDNLRKR